ncbi:stage III sporulation protein AC [Hathewaya proteolytica DSM 3090]|uniref:Stage III sporulation protein AC n=1 Tax=Hathewaya proteolytica DSM 3090 TaxID=1121331 RepID=A0A1M6L5D7_9CLOT|nr:stage III sporulation protein AC [Hathewaya proteolytica]SHJ66422.1 stage III sporulation protein AC [Hathewaya proteolytica DSM 3090]
MMDVSLILKIAGVGILVIVLDKVLKSAGKEDFAVITNLAGIIIILLMVVKLLNELFNTVKTLFLF